MRFDLVVVGAGPAGAATALGALHEDPSLSVALLDRSTFPRDKSCGDGIAPHILDLLATVGVTGILEDWVPVERLRVCLGSQVVDGKMARPTWVVPRKVFDARLVEAAQRAGARLIQHRVRSVRPADGSVGVDEELEGRVLVGADGAHSLVRREVGARPSPMAVALRGYSPPFPIGPALR